MPECNNCGYSCAEFKDLAKHIVANKKSHRRGVKWASSFLLKVQFLNQKQDLNGGRIALTDEQKEAKQNAQREISGRIKFVETVCPRCKSGQRQTLPIEFADDPFTWRKNKVLVVNCNRCTK